MITQKSQLEIKVKDQDHTYQCPVNATLVECLEALNTFRSYIYGRIKEVEEANQPNKEQPAKVVLEESQPKPEQVIDGNQ